MQKLTTQWGETLAGTPWTGYPRPQMRRESYVNLNGEWDLTVDAAGDGSQSCRTKIRVPFCPESALSGVEKHFPEGSELIYSRKFSLPENFHRGRVLLHIGAADQNAVCYVNEKAVGSHRGGYEAMTFDITDALREGENLLQISVTDDLRDQTMPYGKQTLTRGGMWYTPVSGIWQTVWLESVPEQYIRSLHIQVRGASVTIDTGDESLAGEATVAGLGRFPLERGKVTITPENPRFWSPEDPWLYEFTLTAGQDRVDSYFALRTLEIKTVAGLPRLCLNGKPYFFHGLLDQGYWPDGLFTPAAPEAYAWDIQRMKALGFNTLRKHIKVEPEEFYYQCDKLGMIVFQDMVNNGDYAYTRDTALPTIGLQRRSDIKLHRDPETRNMFLRTMEATVRQLRNHPCVCYWTIFNEGWGQFDADSTYEKLKALDDTRFIDATSGWFRRKKTDVDSRHVYFRKLRLKAGQKPLVVSEFGGYSCKLLDHSFNPDQTYGYGKFADVATFDAALESLYLDQVLPLIPKGLCAAIYTQVSDVEDETNGMVTYDRRVTKADPEKMSAIARLLGQAIEV